MLGGWVGESCRGLAVRQDTMTTHTPHNRKTHKRWASLRLWLEVFSLCTLLTFVPTCGVVPVHTSCCVVP